ncbi:MAG: protease modulator HflC [Phycisphaerales bacterium]|nr:protease modulator HflC [Phycisphaerales bacterium]
MKAIGILIAVFLVLVLLLSCAFVVPEGQQVVVTQFGKVVRTETEAGLYWKKPFIQNVIPFEKRLLPWEGDPEDMPTRDKRRIYIEAWARWRIVDPKTFLTAVGTIGEGQQRLDDIVDSAVRSVIAKNNLIDAVRSTNTELWYESDELKEDDESQLEQIEAGRKDMEVEITRIAGQGLPQTYGMELKDVHIKRINYIQNVRQKVYERMRSERNRIASLYESEADEERSKILGQTQKELDEIEGEMTQRTREIMGEADAEVIDITARSFGRDPEFYAFLRQLEAYRKTLGKGTRLVLSTESEFLSQMHATEKADQDP